MKYKGSTIIPIPELSGCTYAFEEGKEIYVSDSIYTLLQDPESYDAIMSQVQVIPMMKMMEKLFDDFKKRGAKEL